MPDRIGLYLDSCALLRLFDEMKEDRILLEAQAIETFLLLARQRKILWVSGEVIEAELLGNPDSEIRGEVIRLLAYSAESVILEESSFDRATYLESLGYGPFDALHLASAEQAGALVMLTTDDRLLRKARRGLGNPLVKVQNPVEWYEEFRQ